MNILIVEDDQFFASHLSRAFKTNKLVHRVDTVSSLSGFMSIFPILEGYDIVLTDIWLPTSLEAPAFDGFYIIRAIREAHIKVPIIVISGRDDISRIQKAFEMGANDYIVKGVRMKELELRVMHWFKYHHFARISHTEEENTYIYKHLMYDVNRHEFLVEKQVIPLTKSSKNILQIFFTNAEKLLSENFLVSKIWGDISFDIRRNIRVSISRLRTSLEPFRMDTWLRTIHGEWYIFASED